MALAPLEEILQNFPGLTAEKRRLAEKLYAALSGDMKRDVLHNYGRPMTAETQDDFIKEFDAFMNEKMKRALSGTD